MARWTGSGIQDLTKEQGNVRNMPMRAPTKSSSRINDLAQFYRTLHQFEAAVGGKQRLSDCDGRMQWSARGAYFFFEAGEPRIAGRAGGDRTGI